MNTKEYSFWDLISEYHIEIPAIQRDYAQGRKSERRIAISLINDLFETLISVETKKINLHFVYGKIDNQHLIPLDGQQRLTTLFLLHWFLSIGFLSENNKNTLSKFIYETRPSSEDFCLKLIKESIEYENDKKVSEQVENSKWFFLSWKNDPTVSAMLNMLDIIQSKFKQPDETLFIKLIEKNSPVQFHFLPLKEFKLDDKIYVKMNSRGKPLTEFENFKANFSILFDIENKSKLDNEWLDIFWKFEKEKQNININDVDNRYLNFLKNITLNFYLETKNIDNTFIYNFNIFDKYKDVYSSNSEYLKHLSRVLDSLHTFGDKEKYFENFLMDYPDYRERLRFYAVIRFFIQKGNLNDTNQELYNKWIRVCGNLINNTYFDDHVSFYRAIRSIKDLSSNIDDLYEYLSRPEAKMESFLQKQSEEEKIKATLILQDKNWETEIYDIEKHNYFAGQIGFILEFSKIDEKYDLELFKNYSAMLRKLFSNEFKDNKNCLFQRALLTFGDYLVPIDYYSKTFCTFKESLREKNDNWRKVFDDKDKRIFLKNLLDAIHMENIEKDLQDIIDKYSEIDWKNLFIKNKGVIEYCDNYRIAEWGNKIALSRSNAYYWRRHAELYSYVLYLELKKENKNVYYNDRSDEASWICIKWEGKNYYIREDDNDYYFTFCEGNADSDGLKDMQQYVEEVISKKNLKKKPISI
jgi:hypothetical protein